ncbi:MAG: glycosyltransferase family 2 protein [Mangrovibacterium sp.]
MNNYERIQLVILSYNRIDCIPRLFDELLLPAAKLDVLITFIDNNSDIELQRFLEKYKDIPNIEIIINNENFGVSKGRNIGFKKSKREFVINLDDDSLIELENLNLIPEIFDKLPSAGILAFRIIHGLTDSPQNDHGNKLIEVGNFHGAGHAIRKDLFQKIGYLDENCFFGAEEIEFSMHALSAGFKTIYTPTIIVRHFSFQRFGNGNIQRRINWARNYSMVLFRYLPFSKASLFCFRLFISYSINEIKLFIFFAVCYDTRWNQRIKKQKFT